MSIDDYINKNFDEITKGIPAGEVENYLNAIRKFYLDHNFEVADETLVYKEQQKSYTIRIPRETIEKVCIDVISDTVIPAEMRLASTLETLSMLIDSHEKQIASLQQVTQLQTRLIETLTKENKALKKTK